MKQTASDIRIDSSADFVPNELLLPSNSIPPPSHIITETPSQLNVPAQTLDRRDHQQDLSCGAAREV